MRWIARRRSRGCGVPASRCARRSKTLLVVDHNVPTSDRTKPNPDPESAAQIAYLAENARLFGLEYYDEFDKRQGICHVVGPEQGFTLPGVTLVCGDSHTATHGAFGALAFGIGTSEVEHVLATQTLIQSQVEEHARGGRRQAAAERHRQGPHPRHHRRDRRRRRHRLRAGICRRGDPRAVDGRPHDGLQHVGRGGRQDRHDRAGREDLRNISKAGRRRPRARPGTMPCATGRRCAATTAPISTARSGSMRRSFLRSSPGAPVPSRSSRSPAACRCRPTSPTATSAAPPMRALDIYGAQRRREDHRHHDRSGVHRLVHQFAHRGPARGRARGERQARSIPMSMR